MRRSMPVRHGWSRCLTTQNTRLAEAYGSVVITVVTSAENQAMPVVGAIVPIRWARWTS